MQILPCFHFRKNFVHVQLCQIIVVWLLGLLQLVIQLRVNLCKCLYTQLAFCFSIEILPTLLALDTLSLFGQILLVKDRTLHNLQVRSDEVSVLEFCWIGLQLNSRQKFVNQSLVSIWRSDLCAVLGLRNCFNPCLYVCIKFTYATILYDAAYMCVCFVDKHAMAIPSCTSVSDAGVFQGSYGWAVHQQAC